MESCFISCGGLSTGDASSGDSEHSCSLSDMRRFDIAFGNEGAVGDWGCDRYYDTIATDTMIYKRQYTPRSCYNSRPIKKFNGKSALNF